MDDAILQRLYELYDISEIPKGIMPMTIANLGDSSVAKLPTLLGLILKNKMNGHKISSEDKVLFASVGSVMNVNCMIYKV